MTRTRHQSTRFTGTDNYGIQDSLLGPETTGWGKDGPQGTVLQIFLEKTPIVLVEDF